VNPNGHDAVIKLQDISIERQLQGGVGVCLQIGEISHYGTDLATILTVCNKLVYMNQQATAVVKAILNSPSISVKLLDLAQTGLRSFIYCPCASAIEMRLKKSQGSEVNISVDQI
jgi:hypothetical protein